MKKIFIIITLFYTITLASQSKHEQKTKDKLELAVINNGIDFKEMFVVYNNYLCAICGGVENSWNSSLLDANLDTGYWYGARDNITIKGRYKFIVNKSSIIISDSKTNFGVVATITHKNPGLINFMNNKNNRNLRDYIIKSLIESNPY
tara:strand:+ start:146 stop:589 length:444 start_codon:yes stop_codon:yes gene_type:complete